MKKILLLFIIISFNDLFSQDYFNKIIPFDYGNPNPAGLYYHNNRFIVPIIYPGEVSSLIVINSKIEYYHYSYFVFSFRPISIINNQIFLYAKDRSKLKGLKLMNLNQDFSENWVKNYDTKGEYNFATYSMNLGGHIYYSFFDDFDNKKHREIGLKKIDALGNEIWSKNYSQNDKLNYPWVLDMSIDSNLLLSSRVVYTDKYGGWPQLIKLDTSGNIIWKNDSNEQIIDGATPVLIAQLSDSNIVQSYKIDKWNDPEFVINNWNLIPIRMKWFDINGHFLFEKLLTFPSKDLSYFYQLESGKGDYFFAYGQYEVDEPDDLVTYYNYGLITKYSNQGDTIWTHRYQHPDFDTSNVSFVVVDIEEMDNGDIVALGVVTPPGEKGQIWLFRINEYGCYSDDSCNEIVVGTEDFIDIGENAQSIKIYPNPASNFITVELGTKFQTSSISWGVYDIEGRKVLGGSLNSGLKLQTSNIVTQTSNIVQFRLSVVDIQPSGVYFLRVNDDKGRVGVGKFVVE